MFFGKKNKGRIVNQVPNISPSLMSADVKSILYVNTGRHREDLENVLSGSRDVYRSESYLRGSGTIFNSLSNFEAYVIDNAPAKTVPSGNNIVVYFFGYTKEEAEALLSQGKFTELVIRAAHLCDIWKAKQPLYIENIRYNKNLLINEEKSSDSSLSSSLS